MHPKPGSQHVWCRPPAVTSDRCRTLPHLSSPRGGFENSASRQNSRDTLQKTNSLIIQRLRSNFFLALTVNQGHVTFHHWRMLLNIVIRCTRIACCLQLVSWSGLPSRQDLPGELPCVEPSCHQHLGFEGGHLVIAWIVTSPAGVTGRKQGPQIHTERGVQIMLSL